jgi:hypothetical protein
MCAEFAHPHHDIPEPTVVYDEDMPPEGQEACDALFRLIDRDPVLTTAELQAGYQDAAEVLAATHRLKAPQRTDRHATRLLRSLGSVFGGEYDFMVEYDRATESAAQIQHKPNDPPERQRLNRIKLYAGRMALYRTQRGELPSDNRTT